MGISVGMEYPPQLYAAIKWKVAEFFGIVRPPSGGSGSKCVLRGVCCHPPSRKPKARCNTLIVAAIHLSSRFHKYSDESHANGSFH